MKYQSLVLVPVKFFKSLEWKFDLEDCSMIFAHWNNAKDWISLSEDQDIRNCFSFIVDEDIFTCFLNTRRCKVSISVPNEKSNKLMEFIKFNSFCMNLSNLEMEKNYYHDKFEELNNRIFSIKEKLK